MAETATTAASKKEPTVAELMQAIEDMKGQMAELQAAQDVGPQDIPAPNVERITRTSEPVDEEATEELTLDAAAKLVPADERPKGRDGKDERVMSATIRGDYAHVGYADGSKVIVPKDGKKK